MRSAALLKNSTSVKRKTRIVTMMMIAKVIPMTMRMMMHMECKSNKLTQTILMSMGMVKQMS
jgi:hypothetical protein